MYRLASPMLTLSSLILFGPVASGQGILGPAGGKDTPTVFPTPGVGLPAPTQVDVTGLPSGVQAQGVAYFGSDNALVSSFGDSMVLNIEISSASTVAVIDTSPCDATGSIAVAPDLQSALMVGTTSTLCVIRAPFVTGATIDTVPLSDTMASYQTQGIVFNTAGRAFVLTRTGVDVLDPPYASVEFTIPVPSNNFSGAIAITPDGNQLLVTRIANNRLMIFTAPFSPSSVGAQLTIDSPSFSSPQLNGVKVTPDGTRALIVDGFDPYIFSVAAPFDATSSYDSIWVPAAGDHEDIDISADGQLAVATGNGFGDPDLVFLEAPFTAAGATVHYVQVLGGRGNGAFRFLPPGLAPGLTVSKSAVANVPSGADLTYTIAYANTGSLDATNVVLRDAVPVGTSFVSASAGGVLAAGEVSWSLGTLTPASSGSVTMTVNVTANSGTVDNNDFSIEGDSVPRIFGPPVSTQVLSGPVTYCTAGTSANGCTAMISATGSPSATAPSGFSLSVSGAEGAKSGLFFIGSNGRQAVPWGSGTSFLCVVPPTVRIPPLAALSGSAGVCAGAYSIDLNALWCPSCSHPGKNPGPGALVQGQFWYRDPLNTSNQTTSLSDAIEFSVNP